MSVSAGSSATQSPTTGVPPGFDPRVAPGGEARAGLAVLGEDVVGAAVADGDAARLEPCARYGSKASPNRVPAERLEVGHCAIVPTCIVLYGRMVIDSHGSDGV